jgi:uroporphyrinogen-III decarboxylase
MTVKDKLISVFNFDTDAPPPRWEFGYWAGTARRWYEEGLERKRGVSDALKDGDSLRGGMGLLGDEFEDIKSAVEIDEPIVRFPLEMWIFPKFQPKVLGQDDHGNILLFDENGNKKLASKDNTTIAKVLEGPVQNREDWEQLKVEKLNPTTAGRLPEDLAQAVSQHAGRDYPLTVGGPPVGFFGALRELFGEPEVYLAFYDNPELVREIIDYLADFWIELLDKVIHRIKPDCFNFWEDMCYKNGPMVSPDLIKEFLSPAYKKMTRYLRENGVTNILMDTDGDCASLIPVFLEAGLDGIYPMEVAAGMNVVEIRKQFPNLKICGGIDKRALIAGKDKIAEELNDKLAYMLQQGGYIPFIDHHVPPDVPLENFLFYRELLNQKIKDFKNN